MGPGSAPLRGLAGMTDGEGGYPVGPFAASTSFASGSTL
jgi:hypothetical protein